jgi:glycosyltransferase involved in cell wall biosynthesis
VVTTDVPGCREVLVAGETGLLVPPRDAPALAAALESLITNLDWASQLGAGGRKLVAAEFSVQAMAKRTFDVYENLLGRPLGRS